MTLGTIKEKLHTYLEKGDPKKVKAFYAMVQDEIEENNLWTDEFVNELDKREYEMDNGLVKTYTLNEMITEARTKMKKKVKNAIKNAPRSK